MLNQIVLQGRLTADPELKRTQSGIAVCSFLVACDADVAAKDGTRKTDFISVTAWRGTAEFVHKWFSKGDLILLSGRMTSQDWMDKEGNKRRSWFVQADRINFCGKRQSDSSEAGTKEPEAPEYYDAPEDGELPF